MGWRRHRGVSYDIVTPTERERRDDEVATRRKRYFAIMIPLSFARRLRVLRARPNTSARVAALALAAVLPPIAAIVGNAKPR